MASPGPGRPLNRSRSKFYRKLIQISSKHLCSETHRKRTAAMRWEKCRWYRAEISHMDPIHAGFSFWIILGLKSSVLRSAGPAGAFFCQKKYMPSPKNYFLTVSPKKTKLPFLFTIIRKTKNTAAKITPARDPKQQKLYKHMICSFPVFWRFFN